MNKNELKAVMVKNGDRQEDLAAALDMSASALSSRMNGNTPFTQPEIEAIVVRYSLTPEDVMRIFFAQLCYS